MLRNVLFVIEVLHDPFHEFDSVAPTQLPVECVHDAIRAVQRIEALELPFKVLNETCVSLPYPLNEVIWVIVAEEHPLVDCYDFLFHITEDELE